MNNLGVLKQLEPPPGIKRSRSTPVAARRPRETWSKWPGEEPADETALRGLLKPIPADRMTAYPISTRINSVKNDDAALIEPVMASAGVSV
jgi:putative SOS response-associated peptidase YedK